MKGHLIDYLRMSAVQQKQVRDHLLTKSMTVESLPNWRFWVRADGDVMRRKGMHQPTEAYRRHMDAEMARMAGAPAPSKDQPILYGSGTRFSISRG